MRIEEIDKIRFQNIEMTKIPSPNEIPDYLMRYFCQSLNYHVKKYVEEKREKEKTNNQEVKMFKTKKSKKAKKTKTATKSSTGQKTVKDFKKGDYICINNNKKKYIKGDYDRFLIILQFAFASTARITFKVYSTMNECYFEWLYCF